MKLAYQPARYFVLLLLVILFEACSSSKIVVDPSAKKDVDDKLLHHGPIDVPREFRAAWVATVANINWPSKPGLSVEEQQKEAIALLDSLERLNFNAVVFQVRPQADALYASELEPWSYYLTGEQGKAPAPFYDPLEFWIREAHARGMELHAWLNPYRAHHTSGGKAPGASSIIHKMPESVVRLEQGYWWFDPALESTQEHSLAVVKDIVSRYDVDGIHFDDYFYPYESYNGGKDFPDDVSWVAYQKSGGKLSRADWRRQSVNEFIQKVYAGIKEVKEDVKFGLSPFGIWRPGYPSSIAGMDQYNTLYADAKLWLNEGWVDYFSPQLYWPINRIAQSFPVLLNWWQEQNTHQRHLWPGINVAAGGRGEDGADEVENQIMISRGITGESPGVVHWSVGPLLRNDSLKARLARGVYKNQALVPVTDWLSAGSLKKPDASVEKATDYITVKWDAPEKGKSFQTIVYYQYGSGWEYQVMGEKFTSLRLERKQASGDLTAVQLAYVDKNGRIGELSTLEL
ncbi:glycoside hydrolase family 10 protein [Albibacterium indicum]|uniref:glycoside hydrolase family 10 protein n=1 Tax=Albibacterium indicum TaxID=2292082 RepID=UPI000E4A6A5F|nr:family 10 glycosylhydrolase [Pedobacter indicus]